MSEQAERWKMRPGRVGIFGEYTIQGFECENAGGKRAWWTMWWGSNGPVHNAWVEDKTFRRVILHLNGYGNNGIEDLGEMKDVPEIEQKAIFGAIETWEKPIGVEAE